MALLDQLIRRVRALEDTPPGVGLTNIKISAGTASQNLSAITFSNGSGVSFGLNGSVITASVNAGGGGVALAAGTQTATSGTISFANSNGVSFGMSGSNQITASHNALTSQSNQAYSAANGSATFQTLSFANSNGVSFSTGTQGVFASHNALTSQTIQTGNLSALGNTLGTNSVSATYNASGLQFAASGVASVGVSNGSIVFSVPSGGGGLTNIKISAGTASQNLSAITFSNGSGVSFGLNGSVITASVNAGGGATMSQWPMSPPGFAMSSLYTGASTTVVGGSQSTLSAYVAPYPFPAPVAFNDVRLLVGGGAGAAGTGSVTGRHVIGFYTLTGNTLSRVTDFAWNFLRSQNSATAISFSYWAGAFSDSTATSVSSLAGNVSASLTGNRVALLNPTTVSQSLGAGQYWLVHLYNQRSSNLAAGGYNSAFRSDATLINQFFQEFNNASTHHVGPIAHGIASYTSSSPTQFAFDAPASIAVTLVTGSQGTSQLQWPLVYLRSVTA